MKHQSKSEAPAIDYSALRVNIDPRKLASVATFRATNDIRHCLGGVLIEKAPQGGVYLVASNGHTIAIVYAPDGLLEGFDSVILRTSRELLAACKKSWKFNPRLMVNGARLFMADGNFGFDAEATDREFFVQPGPSVIEGKFPDWARVMPDFPKLTQTIRHPVASKYLARVEQALSVHHSKASFAATRLWQEPDSGVVAIQCDPDPYLLILVMPLRTSDREGADLFNSLINGPFGEAKRRKTAELANELTKVANPNQRDAANHSNPAEAAA